VGTPSVSVLGPKRGRGNARLGSTRKSPQMLCCDSYFEDRTKDKVHAVYYSSRKHRLSTTALYLLQPFGGLQQIKSFEFKVMLLYEEM
jgi:hypothetical protein